MVSALPNQSFPGGWFELLLEYAQPRKMSLMNENYMLKYRMLIYAYDF